MRFVTPWWLLALPVAVGLTLVTARYGRRHVPRRQHRIAVGVRVTGIALLVLALAQPLLVR
ncbi:MAG: hypothetical protein QNJ88_11345, partial [Acidimicrobiia bacterium]|nr:hypothetical protein [Acidimicrobiia bacterium]